MYRFIIIKAFIVFILIGTVFSNSNSINAQGTDTDGVRIYNQDISNFPNVTLDVLVAEDGNVIQGLTPNDFNISEEHRSLMVEPIERPLNIGILLDLSVRTDLATMRSILLRFADEVYNPSDRLIIVRQVNDSYIPTEITSRAQFDTFISELSISGYSYYRQGIRELADELGPQLSTDDFASLLVIGNIVSDASRSDTPYTAAREVWQTYGMTTHAIYGSSGGHRVYEGEVEKMAEGGLGTFVNYASPNANTQLSQLFSSFQNNRTAYRVSYESRNVAETSRNVTLSVGGFGSDEFNYNASVVAPAITIENMSNNFRIERQTQPSQNPNEGDAEGFFLTTPTQTFSARVTFPDGIERDIEQVEIITRTSNTTFAPQIFVDPEINNGLMQLSWDLTSDFNADESLEGGSTPVFLSVRVTDEYALSNQSSEISGEVFVNIPEGYGVADIIVEDPCLNADGTRINSAECRVPDESIRWSLAALVVGLIAAIGMMGWQHKKIMQLSKGALDSAVHAGKTFIKAASTMITGIQQGSSSAGNVHAQLQLLNAPDDARISIPDENKNSIEINETIDLYNDSFRIGREIEQGLRLVIYHKQISRHHCTISVENGRYYISDIASANGTFVNDTQLTPRQRFKIAHGDVIRLASSSPVVFKFAELEAAQQSSSETQIEGAGNEALSTQHDHNVTMVEDQDDPEDETLPDRNWNRQRSPAALRNVRPSKLYDMNNQIDMDSDINRTEVDGINFNDVNESTNRQQKPQKHKSDTTGNNGASGDTDWEAEMMDANEQFGDGLK